MNGTSNGKQTVEWEGPFGDEYTRRSPGSVPANLKLFESMLWGNWRNVKSVIEFGCGTGANLVALRKILPDALLQGVEVNELALEQAIARVKGKTSFFLSSMLEWVVGEKSAASDVALTKGVLIHIDPQHLRTAYRVLYESSRRWIILAEYYNPVPVEIEYRGRRGMLWKRDFAGEMLDLYPDLRLVDYGFHYHRDPQPQDDITWFVLEKTGQP